MGDFILIVCPLYTTVECQLLLSLNLGLSWVIQTGELFGGEDIFLLNDYLVLYFKRESLKRDHYAPIHFPPAHMPTLCDAAATPLVIAERKRANPCEQMGTFSHMYIYIYIYIYIFISVCETDRCPFTCTKMADTSSTSIKYFQTPHHHMRRFCTFTSWTGLDGDSQKPTSDNWRWIELEEGLLPHSTFSQLASARQQCNAFAC